MVVQPVHRRIEVVQRTQWSHLEPGGHAAAIEQGQAGLVDEAAGSGLIQWARGLAGLGVNRHTPGRRDEFP